MFTTAHPGARTPARPLVVAAFLAAAALAGAAPAPPDTEPPMQQHNALKNPDGSWRYTNRLIESSSPYLLQHAHNPVDWREWNAETIAEARRLDKPIFLSVGYSTCYWCHVMERQVFENPEIAALMNESFINVKVDREQRPDVDEIYMTATQLATGHGGWPNSVFLTPDLKPFYAGTYFGPEDQFGRPGFPRILEALSDAWRNKRADVLAHAEQVGAAVRDVLEQRAARPAGALPGRALVDSAILSIEESYDPRDGGFGMAPKFPHEANFPLLLAEHRRAGDPALLEVARHTLDRMIQGGIFDQIAGGFHRYSTDAKWRVPHFEKMLYNQAHMAVALLDAFELTRDDSYRRAAEQTLDFVATVMTGPRGELYSALDAETDQTEGKHYLWTEAEIRGILDEEQQKMFFATFGLAPVPEIPGHRHPEGGALFMLASVDDVAVNVGLATSELLEQIDGVRARLLAARSQRERPMLDTKVIASWNGMMIDAFARAAQSLDSERWRLAAERAADFALAELVHDGDRLRRIWRNGEAEIDAFHEDYAYLVRGLLSLHRATGEDRWLDAAQTLTDAADRHFWDERAGGWFAAPDDPHLIARAKSPMDDAIPSGNSVAIHNLLDLYELTGDEGRLRRADEALRAFAALMEHSPGAFTHMIHALQRRLELAPAAPDLDEPDEDPEDLAAPEDAHAVAPPARALAEEDGDPSLVIAPEAFASVDAVLPGRPFRIALRLNIAPGWHISANPSSHPTLLPTVIDVLADAPLEDIEITYPDGAALEAAPAGEPPIQIYEGRPTIFATLEMRNDWRPADSGDGRLHLRIRYRCQPCNANACLAPTEGVETLSLPVITEHSRPPREINDEIFSAGRAR